MILLVVPLGFSTGTELLKTSAHSSHTDFPMVNLDPPDSVQGWWGKNKGNHSSRERHKATMRRSHDWMSR